MRYIKTYELISKVDYEKLNEDLKKLLNYFIKFFNDLGFTDNNFLATNQWETEFNDKDGNYIFCIIMSIRNNKIYLKIKKSLTYSLNNIVISFIEYLKFNVVRDTDYKIIFINETSYGTNLFVVKGDVNEIISKISKKDFEIYMDSNKYNL